MLRVDGGNRPLEKGTHGKSIIIGQFAGHSVFINIKLIDLALSEMCGKNCDCKKAFQ